MPNLSNGCLVHVATLAGLEPPSSSYFNLLFVSFLGVESEWNQIEL